MKELEYAPIRTEFQIGKIKVRVDAANAVELSKQIDEIEKALAKYATEKPPTAAEGSPQKQPDSTELLNHSWKGKKQPDGSYDEGSLKFGWDFADEFSPEIVAKLIQGKLEVSGITFSINENHKIITARENR